MTWYASHIYATPTPALLAVLAAHPVLSTGAYLVKSLKEHPWGAEADRHSLPRAGLLVIREICQTGTDEALWHQQHQYPCLAWEALAGPDELEILRPRYLPVSAFGELRYELELQAYPPPAFLRFLKHLQQTTQTTLSFYHHFSGAEQAVQQEFAWVFGKTDRVYVANGQEVYQYTHGGIPPLPYKVTKMPDTQVLTLMLKQHGLTLTRRYFALHSRSFDWASCRLPA